MSECSHENITVNREGDIICMDCGVQLVWDGEVLIEKGCETDFMTVYDSCERCKP